MTIEQEFENLYLYGAFSPTDGRNVILELPFMSTVCMQAFLNEFASSPEAKETLNIIVMDNAAIHKSNHLRIPENVRIIFQPGYAPDLNPAERIWEHLKGWLGGELFGSLDCLSEKLTGKVLELTDDIVQSLTAFDWIMQAIYGQSSM